MKVIHAADAMQRLALQWRKSNQRVALVPTMGYLHAGHLSLVHEARRRVGPAGLVVLSIYVNPTQFAPHEDLSRYPRDFARDRQLCRKAGVDVIFAPDNEAMYPGKEQGQYSTFVVEEVLGRELEGGTRPTHFRGVTTVVAKLFNLVLPELAVFGAKDFQQSAILRRMVKDLNFPIEMVVAPTVREPDGLAMSSRNKYLSRSERRTALVLSYGMEVARRLLLRHPGGLPVQKVVDPVARIINSQPAARLDYLAFVDPLTLQPQKRVRPGVQMTLAVFVGKTRLIDNTRL
jgi:pantoate--beta-alanine ligase